MTTTMRDSETGCNGETAAIVAIAELLREEVDRRVSLDADYADRERALHEVANAAIRTVQRQDLQEIADRFTTPEVIVAAKVYRQHEEATPSYHGLSGSMPVRRWTYREVGVHNGPTIVPLELAAGLIERTTPALAHALLTGCADVTSRDVERAMRADLREPPSRTTMERVVSGAGAQLRDNLAVIEPVLRASESVPEEALSIAIGLDRTTVPMEEPLSAQEAAKRRRKKRKKPYSRKPPEPVEVNYRMGYVGTVSFVDLDGRCVRTLSYFASAEQGPKRVVDSMMRDVVHALRSRPELPVCVVQDGAPEMWNLIRGGMKKHKVTATAEMIDRAPQGLGSMDDMSPWIG